MSKSKKITIIIVLLVITALETLSAAAQAIKAQSVTVSCETSFMVPGQAQQLSARVYPENEASQTVNWKSSNPSIASVDQNGKLKANRAGTVWVSAAAADGSNVSGSLKITVSDAKVKSIEIDAPTTEIVSGESVTFTAMISPVHAANKEVEWKSANTNIATVSQDGIVSGKKIGTTMITAAAKDGSGIAGRIRINVVDTKAIIILDIPDKDIYVDDEIVLSPELVLLKDGREIKTNESLWIDNSNSLIASIEGWTLTGISEGSTTITVTSDKYRTAAAEVTINVRKRPAQVIISDHEVIGNCAGFSDEYILFAGEKMKLYGYVEDLTVPEINCYDQLPAARNQSLVWSSTDQNVASVDENGNVSALSLGEAYIIAERPVTGESQSVKISVDEFRFTVNSFKIAAGDKYRIGSYLNIASPDLKLFWSTSDKDIAIVNETGLVHAVSPGKAIISVYIEEHPDAAAEAEIVVSAPVPAADQSVEGSEEADIVSGVDQPSGIPQGLDEDEGIHIVSVLETLRFMSAF